MCPISRPLFEQAAGGGIAFPTRSVDAHQVSTRRENRLRVRSFSSIAHHIFTRRLKASRLEVQIFGVRKSADTRKALRFFSERRVKTHFVDLTERPASLGELRRFVQKFGVAALVDRDSKRFDELGLRYAQLSDDRWLEKLSDEPLLLRMPLVRNANQLVIGADESIWRTWMEKK